MKLTPEKLTAFCAALAETGIVAKACKAVDISRQQAYKWRQSMPEFAKAWDDALEIGITALEDEAHRRAFEGTDEPVFHQGAMCGSMRRYSDTLAIFLLKAHRPDKYRENTRMELTGANGGPVQVDDSERATRVSGLLALAQARMLNAPPVDFDDPAQGLV